MSDDDKDLIEALRLQGWNDAADCIQQLERERKAMAMRDAGYDVYSKLESDLSKAVDALRDMCAEFRGHDLPYGSKAYHKATTVLNELSKQ